MRARRAVVIGMAAAAGLALGWMTAGARERRHRGRLFSPSPLRRLAALGWLERQASPSTLHLLRDYLAWERQPMLRRRASRLVRRFEATL